MSWYDEEAIYQDADIEQAQFEEESNRYHRQSTKAKALIAEGKVDEGTKLCLHGHAGKLTGSCSEDDPRYGEEGYRCYECGAVVTDLHGEVLHVR